MTNPSEQAPAIASNGSYQGGPLRVALIVPAEPSQPQIPVPPIGLSSMIKYYELNGAHNDLVDIRIFDENAEKKRLTKRILDWQPHLVGLGCMTPTIARTLEMAGEVRAGRPGTLIVGGGIHAQVRPEDGLRDGPYDLTCSGAGEEPLLQLIDRYLIGGEGQAALPEIPNLSYLDGEGTLQKTSGWTLDLASFPLPEHHHFHLDYYFAPREYAPKRHGRAANILASRGCPFVCTFCYNSFYQPSVNYHDVEATVDHVKHLHEAYEIEQITFQDDLFFMDRKRVRRFCELMIERCPDVTWACTARTSTIKVGDLELLRLMKESGCNTIAFGFESGNDEMVVKLKGRDCSVEKHQIALDLVHQANIDVFGFFMCGAPGETEEQMEDTGRFILKNIDKMAGIHLFIYTPYPGATLYDEVEQAGLLDGVDLGTLASSVLGQGEVKVFNTAVSPEKILAFRSRIMRRIMAKVPFRYKLKTAWSLLFDNPMQLYQRFKAVYLH